MQAVTVMVSALVTIVALGVDGYSGAFDKVNVEEIIKNERLFGNYLNCFLDKGNCTPDAKDLKEIIPEGLQTDCEKCTPEQKEKVDIVLKYVLKNKPDEFEEMSMKYDPDMTYRKKYELIIKDAKE